jgi:hypothetical protein
MLSFQEVFADWREREIGHDWGWEAVWKEKGFDNWDDWRMSYVDRFGLLGREWKEELIEQPCNFAQNAFVGAYPGWTGYLPAGESSMRFSEMENAMTNPKVRAVMNGFPIRTTVIAIRLKDECIIFDGTHRIAALAQYANGGVCPQTQLRMHVTDFDESERELFEQCRTLRRV